MFGKVSVFSILLSVILSPAVSVLVACALLAVILYGFGIVSIIAYPLTFVCEQLSKYVIFIVGTFSDIPFSSVNARKPYFYIWLALIAVMVIVGYFVKNKANYAVKSAVISLCVLALGFAVYSFTCYLTRPGNWPTFLRMIAIANLSYCVLTLIVLIVYRFEVTVLGIGYFVGEVAIVAGLVVFELLTVRRAADR